MTVTTDLVRRAIAEAETEAALLRQSIETRLGEINSDERHAARLEQRAAELRLHVEDARASG